jgi:hypothetical protein
MGIAKQLNVDLVLLFKSEKKAGRFGGALWTALEEVSEYFTPTSQDGWLEVPIVSDPRTRARVQPRFRRWFVAPVLPDDVQVGSSDSFEKLDGDEAQELWGAAERRTRLYDHDLLGVSISSRLGLETAAIITDREIAPPPDWRYLIWSGFQGGAVISTAAIDPRYWGLRDPEDERRVKEVKRRARAATMSVSGSLLGLSRCENPRCFMFAAVDSASTLDEMCSIGVEHEVKGLGRGIFPLDQPDATEVLRPKPIAQEA